MSNIAVTVDQLNKLQATEIVSLPAVREKFIQIYDAIWGEGSGAAVYERESIHFNKIVGDNANLREKVTKFSIFSSFIDLAVCGLSLEPGARAQCYLQPRKIETGTTPDGTYKTYEGRCVLTISGYGELYMRERAGQIRHADNPVLVYEEDSFQFTEKNGQKSVDYTCRIPHTTRHIVAGFIKITRADGSIDYSVMYEEDWGRLKDYSGKQNRFYDQQKGGWVERPNALYTSVAGGIDTGFLCAKIIKHAFRSYPKLRIGRATGFQVNEAAGPDDDFYTLGAPVQTEKVPQEPAPQPFNGPANDLAQGVTVEPGDDGAF